MAQVSFDVAAKVQAENQQYSNNVEFFALGDDGDEAVVRFMYDSTASFNIMTVHDVEIGGGKWRKVNCIRDPQQPTDMCPLCASGNSITNKFFIRMIVYKRDESGKIVAKPMVWERGFSYATRLKSLIDEYGPLTQELFKIKRNGARRSMDTTYDILYCSPKVYNSAEYPMVEDAFKDYNELGTIVLNKDAVAMNTFLATGSFPATQSNANTNATPAEVTNAQPIPQAPATPQPPYVEPSPYAVPTAPAAPTAPAPAPAPGTTDTPPWMNAPAGTAPQRPGPRFY